MKTTIAGLGMLMLAAALTTGCGGSGGDGSPAEPQSVSVTLPQCARDPAQIEGAPSVGAVSLALRGTNDTLITTLGGIGMYPGALAGSDVYRRVQPRGLHDYVIFAPRPAGDEMAYDMDVSRVGGLRLVNNTLELLDEEGSPWLRLEPPHVVDARQVRSDAVISIEGCAFDTSPVEPWGRAVTSPGATRCTVRITWHAAEYPATVDLSWTAETLRNRVDLLSPR